MCKTDVAFSIIDVTLSFFFLLLSNIHDTTGVGSFLIYTSIIEFPVGNMKEPRDFKMQILEDLCL